MATKAEIVKQALHRTGGRPELVPTKTVQENFRDWESETFGLGYGTGEPHVLRALKGFMDAVGRDGAEHGYEYEKLEEAVTAPVAWLLINRLCQVDIIEYGTSPRFGWLTPEGEALRAFMKDKTVGELCEIVCNSGFANY